MPIRISLRLSLAVAALALSGTSVAVWSQDSFTEDFSTTTYRDPVHTTAIWDTELGQLTLAPFAVTLTGSHTVGTVAYHTAISGNLALVAGYSGGVSLFDITDLSNPTLLDTYGAGDRVRGVAIDGPYGYVADGTAGVHVLAIDPAGSLSHIGSINTPGTAWRLAARGELLYVADHSGGLRVIDVTDPTSPTIVGGCAPLGYMVDVKIAGNYAVVADLTAGMSVVDITDPASPTVVATYPGDGNGVDIDGNIAYFVGDEGLVILDVTTPTNPIPLGSLPLAGSPIEVRVEGDVAYVASYGGGLFLIDVSDPTNPLLLDVFAEGGTRAVSVEGDQAFLCNQSLGLRIVDIADPAGLAPSGGVSISGASEVTIEGDYAYVVGDESWQIVDISDPSTPTVVGHYDFSGQINGAIVDGDYAFIDAYVEGWTVLDISNPTAPVLLFNNPDIEPRCMAVRGDRAYLVTDSRFSIYDVSDPAQPLLAGWDAYYGLPASIHLAGNHAFVCDFSEGLIIYDITDPGSITLVGEASHSGLWDIAMSGETVFALDPAGELLIVFDASDPTTPQQVASVPLGFGPYDMTVSGDIAYIAGNHHGLYEFDVTDPTNPRLTHHRSSLVAYEVLAVGDRVYTVSSSSGLQVFDRFQRLYDTEANVGQSLPFADTYDIAQVRIDVVGQGELSWEISSSDGSWIPLSSSTGWQNLTGYFGSDLRWRVTMFSPPTGGQPFCDEVTFEWMLFSPRMELVEDVPNDQGRQVRIHWMRSGADWWYSDHQVTEYAIYRLIDDPALTDEDPARESSWDYIASVPATIDQYYSMVVPTLGDSTESGVFLSTFFVRALTDTPGYDYASNLLSGYSIDNLSPSIPRNLLVFYGQGEGTELSWDECPDTDFRYFRIYRGATEDFTPGPENLIHECVENSWIDPDGGYFVYKVTALDFSGNESAPGSSDLPSDSDTVSGGDVFSPSLPNPFQDETTFRLSLASSGEVRLEIVDVRGRLVKGLIRGELQAGKFHATWYGDDERGHRVSSGVYFARLSTRTGVWSQKVVVR